MPATRTRARKRRARQAALAARWDDLSHAARTAQDPAARARANAAVIGLMIEIDRSPIPLTRFVRERLGTPPLPGTAAAAERDEVLAIVAQIVTPRLSAGTRRSVYRNRPAERNGVGCGLDTPPPSPAPQPTPDPAPAATDPDPFRRWEDDGGRAAD